LNLRDNTICIYRGEQRVIEEVENLVGAVAAWKSEVITVDQKE
jgi:hypothetical protein